MNKNQKRNHVTQCGFGSRIHILALRRFNVQDLVKWTDSDREQRDSREKEDYSYYELKVWYRLLKFKSCSANSSSSVALGKLSNISSIKWSTVKSTYLLIGCYSMN